MSTDLFIEIERSTVLAQLRAQREALVEQIEQATMYLAVIDRYIAQFEAESVSMRGPQQLQPRAALDTDESPRRQPAPRS